MTEYRHAYEVARIAAELIAKHHRHLAGQRIDYVFRDKAAKSKGREVSGTARVVSGLNAFLASHSTTKLVDPNGEVTVEVDEPATPDLRFGVVEIAGDIWDRIDDRQRHALVDHELCHLVVAEIDDHRVLTTRGHDVEEFVAVIERHGLWSRDVVAFADQIQLQLELAP